MNGQCCGGGVRFRLFPKPPYVHPEWPPETIAVSDPPGSIGPGPADERMRLIFPVAKRYSYGVNPGPLGTPKLDFPPYRGLIHRPVCPDDEGNFDTIPEGTPQFAEAHVFGTVRFVLDIWERYFGRRIEWHFARDYRQLEIVIAPQIDNAYAGYGFMEVGAHHFPDGSLAPYALNFDVIAHELGHLILYSTIGLPTAATQHGEYYGFQESGADTTALIAALHFESLLAHLLEETHGNLYTYNELDRFAELVAARPDPARQQRCEDVGICGRLGGRACAFAAADRRGLRHLGRHFPGNAGRPRADPEGCRRGDAACTQQPENAAALQPVFDAAFADRYEEFRAALIEARDYYGIHARRDVEAADGGLFHLCRCRRDDGRD